MTDELKQIVHAMLNYKDEYSKRPDYDDKTYDELMGMLNACIRTNSNVQELIDDYYEKDSTDSFLELRLDSLKLAIQDNNLSEILNECKFLIRWAVDDLPEFFADEPLEAVLSTEMKKKLKNPSFLEDRRWLVIWDEMDYGKNEPAVVSVEYFTENENAGFMEEEIHEILNLKLNQEVERGCMLVRRIK